MLRFWVHIPQKGMIEISIERDNIIKSLNELESQFKNGNISKSHYELQKRQLTEKLETLAAVETVMKLQGKETVEVPSKTSDESENDELFKKYITSPGLKEKNISKGSGMKFSQNLMIAAALLIIAFGIGIGFGIYGLNTSQEVSSVSLYTNDSAFPPYIANNTTNVTNSTNSTKKLLNTTKKVTTPVTQPTTNQTTVIEIEPETNITGAAGEPGSKKTTRKYTNTAGY